MNRIKVVVAGKSYWLHTEEDEQYVHHLGYALNEALEDVMTKNESLSLVEALVLTALNAMDEKRGAVKDADHLREQMKQYIDETQALNKKVSQLQAENKELFQMLEESTKVSGR